MLARTSAMTVVMGSRPPLAEGRTAFLVAWILELSACGGDSGDAANGQDCLVNSDCPPGQMCSLGTCIPATSTRDAATPFPSLDAGPGPGQDAGPGPGQDAGPGPDSADGGSCSSALTCDEAGAECGPLDDGCGAFLDCGDCPGGETCGGEGTPNKCGSGMCTPASCESLGAQCGKTGDGCSGTLECGTCPPDRFCDSNVCLCTPKTCEDVGANCGEPDDGCGTPLSCGVCTAPERCGANAPYQCGCKLESPTNTTYLPFRTARQVNPGPSYLPWQLVERAATIPEFGAYIALRGTCKRYPHGTDVDCRDCCTSDTSTTRSSWDLQLSNTDLAGKLPEDAIIRGVEVSVRALRWGTGKLVKVALMGSDWTSASRLRNVALGDNYQSFVFGGPNDLWGREWTAEDFDDPMFRLNLRVSATATCRKNATQCRTSTVGVDVASVRVHYQRCR